MRFMRSIEIDANIYRKNRESDKVARNPRKIDVSVWSAGKVAHRSLIRIPYCVWIGECEGCEKYRYQKPESVRVVAVWI